MTEIAWSPYSTAEALFRGAAPAWVPAEHQARIRSYELYEQMYWQHPNTYRLLARGQSNTMPIYIPNPRVIVDTIARYVGRVSGFTAEPAADLTGAAGTQADATLAQQWFQALFRRERFLSGFSANKLYGLMRGDYAWHVYADERKAEGRRITIRTLYPGSYYPIYDDVADPESLRAVMLADLVVVDGKEFVRRQLYRKELAEDGTATIMSSLALFATDKWFDETSEPEPVAGFQIIPPTPLDDRIQAIPVYHVMNNPAPNAQFGNSELRGIERLAAAVNQSISDEELTLVLEGLGIYATDAGAPQDEEGNETNWLLGPGRVIELNSPEARFMRVNGVNTVGPFQDHIGYLEGKGEEAVGVNDVAKGKVEVSVAESGIALALRLSPLLARADYMDTFVTDTLANLFYDLGTMWLPVYEGQDFPAIEIMPRYGDRLPLNRKERFTELVQLHNMGAITTKFLLTELEGLGYVFPDGVETMAAEALAEQQQRTNAATPQIEQRTEEELVTTT
jgi:hypothetical protein